MSGWRQANGDRYQVVCQRLSKSKIVCASVGTRGSCPCHFILWQAASRKAVLQTKGHVPQGNQHVLPCGCFQVSSLLNFV